MSIKEDMANLFATPLLDAAVNLKVQHEHYLDILEKLGFTKEEAAEIAEVKLNEVNEIGNYFFQMKKDGMSDEEIKQAWAKKG